MKPPGGRFDEDTYKRAWEFLERNKDSESDAKPAPPPKAAVKRAKTTDTGDETARLSARSKASEPTDTGDDAGRMLARAPNKGRSEIPVDSSMEGPAADGRERLTDTERNLLMAAAALPQVGRGLRMLRGTREVEQSMRPAFRALTGPTKALPAPAKAAAESPKLLTGPTKALPAPAKAAAESPKPSPARMTTSGTKKASEPPKPSPARMTTSGTKKASESSATKAKQAEDAAERAYDARRASDMEAGFKRGGKVSSYKAGGTVRGRGDGICRKGHTKGRYI